MSINTTSNQRHDPYLAFRFPEYRFFMAANFLFTAALLIQEVVIGYELYKITRDPLSIGLLGLAQAAPFIGLSLVGGHVADQWSKKNILLISLLGIMACTLALFFAVQWLHDSPDVLSLQWFIYGMAFLTGTFAAFYSPAGQALRAMLVPKYAFESAATWGSAAWQAGAIIGPAVSGFIYNWAGFGGTLLVVLGLFGVVMLLLSQIRDRKIEQKTEGEVWQKIREGIRFVKQSKMLLYSISLDLFSVLFGGVIAILPVFAEDILKVGAEGLGIMRAAPGVGAVLTLLLLSRISVMGNAWKNLLLNIAGFGVATLVFAVSKNFWLSVVALFFTGAFDIVSVVIRQTLLQLLVPDEMRGRVSSVNGIFVSASNELGAFESGVAASLLGTVPSVIFGGAATLVIVGWVWLRSKALFGVNLKTI